MLLEFQRTIKQDTGTKQNSRQLAEKLGNSLQNIKGVNKLIGDRAYISQHLFQLLFEGRRLSAYH